MNRTEKIDSYLVADGIKSSVEIEEFQATSVPETFSFNQSLTEYEKGFEGNIPFPARLDHSHPLNVRTTGESGLTGDLNQVVKPCGATGELGSSKYYARLDHVHAMSTGNNNYVPATTWPLISGSSDTTTYQALLRTNTWSRGTTKVGDKLAGFKCEILTRVARATINGSPGPKDIFIFREFTFDESGMVKAVSAEKYAYSEWNGLRKPM